MNTSKNDFLGTEGSTDFGAIFEAEQRKVEIKKIDFTRPIGDYPNARFIADFIQNRDKAIHIYTDTLQQNGVAVQDSMEKYLGNGKYYNSSVVKAAIKTPLHLLFEKESGWKEELAKYQKKKKHFELGTYLHQCILEPTKFKRTIVEPKFPLSSLDGVRGLITFWEGVIKDLSEKEDLLSEEGKVLNPDYVFETAKAAVKTLGLEIGKLQGKKKYLEILKEFAGLEAVTAEHQMVINIVYHNYKRYSNGILFELMRHSKREMSMYYTDPETGIKVRTRADAVQFAENIGVDTIISVKSTCAESLGKFAYDSAKHLYEISEGMYLDVASGVTGRDFKCCIMIMLQTTAPYGVAALVWNGEDIEIGRYKYRFGLQTISECKENNSYPGYDAFAEAGDLGFINFKQPTWNAKELHPTEIEN